MEIEYISKKELLLTTGISYGQLYRWKRENLIPEDWFIKKPSYTGQETYFPKEKILERIQTIQQLKDRYPLEDLARMLSPELTGITYRVSRALGEDVVDSLTAHIFKKKINKEFCSFWETCVIYTLGLARTKGLINEDDIERLSENLAEWGRNYHSGAYRLYIVRNGGLITVLIAAKEPPIILDKAFEMLASFDMDEMGTAVKAKLSGF